MRDLLSNAEIENKIERIAQNQKKTEVFFLLLAFEVSLLVISKMEILNKDCSRLLLGVL